MSTDKAWLCWPPGTEPEDKEDWQENSPVMLWAPDEAGARKKLATIITDAADWEIEQWEVWEKDGIKN
jgi:hypothetical protein